MALLLILPIIILFYVLGRAADVVVSRLRGLAQTFGVGVQFLGLLLGILTTLPEMAIAANALAFNLPGVSFGNLIGGIPVILGLILGLTAVFNRSVDTSGNNTAMMSFFGAYLLLPLLLAMDGSVSSVEGAVLVACYGFLLVGLFWKMNRTAHTRIVVTTERRVRRDIISVILGALAIVAASDLIMRLTERILDSYPAIPTFSLGLLLFAVGTNLPELSVAFMAWKRKQSEVSLSHLMGSAVANAAVIGLLALVKPLSVVAVSLKNVIFAAVAVLIFAVTVFQATGRKLTRLEGAGLVAVYVGFFASQLIMMG